MSGQTRIWNLGSVLPHAAAVYGDKTALVSGGRSFSFRELNVLSNRVADSLGRHHTGPGDVVTLYASNCWEWVVSYYGILKTGAAVNPINVMLTPEEVVFVANDCGAKAIIAGADKGPALCAIRSRTPVEQIILFGDGIVEGTIAFAELLRGSADFQAVGVDPDSLATIGYTSGTTGHPKGAMTSHRNVLTSTAMTAVMHARDERDTTVSALPCSHVYGNVVMNAAFWYGMTLVLLPKFNERDALAAIQTHRATMLEGVPTTPLSPLSRWGRSPTRQRARLPRHTSFSRSVPTSPPRRYRITRAVIWRPTRCRVRSCSLTTFPRQALEKSCGGR